MAGKFKKAGGGADGAVIGLNGSIRPKCLVWLNMWLFVSMWLLVYSIFDFCRSESLHQTKPSPQAFLFSILSLSFWNRWANSKHLAFVCRPRHWGLLASETGTSWTVSLATQNKQFTYAPWLYQRNHVTCPMSWVLTVCLDLWQVVLAMEESSWHP